MRDLYVVGVDPGRTTGIAMLGFDEGRLVDSALIQCTHNVALGLVQHLIDLAVDQGLGHRIIAVERFVVGPRTARSADAQAGQITRDLIGALGALQQTYTMDVYVRSASEVKPWATDKRLSAVGVNTSSTMRHAADAARHALYAAVRDGGAIDPLSVHGSTS